MNNETDVSSAPPLIKAKKLGMGLIAVAFLYGLCWLIAALFSVGWVLTVGQVLSGLLLLAVLWMGLTAQVAPCPYCGAQLGEGAFDNIAKGDENLQVECGHCFEWLVSHEGRVRAFTGADDAPHDRYDAPVFEGGRWPDECIVCGEAATHEGEAKKTQANLGALLVGSLSVSSGSVKNIPYCDAHRDVVGLGIEDDCLRLQFPTLAMRRRYIAVNAGADLKAIKVD